MAKTDLLKWQDEHTLLRGTTVLPVKIIQNEGRVFAEKFTPEQKLWQQITETFGYADILRRRDRALNVLARSAVNYHQSYDPFCELRRIEHEFEFDPNTILFLKPSIKNEEAYRALSGWHVKHNPFDYAGTQWTSLEHAYQAMKFAVTNPDLAQKIQRAAIPLKAKLIGDRNVDWVRSDWNAVKDLAMLGPALGIAQSDDEVRSIFDRVGSRTILVEDSINDKYWGRGPIEDGKCVGQSKLGCTWMLARNIVARGQADAVQSEIEGLFS